MAQRTKTIEYAFELSTASVASATARDFKQIAALAIPESTSRTFRSVILEVSFVDNGAAAVALTAILMGVALGAVARSDQTITLTLNNSGENQAHLFTADFTSYFVTNYTGTTMTSDCRITATGPVTQNATAKLIITYEFDDASATTRIKTVKIPMDGNIGDLTASFVNLGGVASQIPNLSTFLPEASIVYRDIFFQMDVHTATTVAEVGQLDMSYDGGTTTVSDLTWGHSLNSDTSYRRIDKQLALSTTAAASIQAKKTSATGGAVYSCLNVVLVVTYEYNHSTSSTIMNSIQVAVGQERGWPGATVTGDKSRFITSILIAEPTTITLVQSAVLVNCSSSAAITHDIRSGSQATRSFVHATSARCGGELSQMRRVDAGESGGVAGITLARGFVNYTLDIFSTGSGIGAIGARMSSLLFLNYTSGKATNGADTHNHTTMWMVRPWATTASGRRIQSAVAITPNIPEADYWLTNVSPEVIAIYSGTSTLPAGWAVSVEVQSGEAEAAGWNALGSGNFESDTEAGWGHIYLDATRNYLQYPLDWDTNERMNIETARDWAFDSTNGTASEGVQWMASMRVTYHTITRVISGTASGFGAGTVTIIGQRQDTGCKVSSTSRSGNGAYSMTWYDDTVNVRAVADDGTNVGASAWGLAT